MVEKLRSNPFVTALLVIIIYGFIIFGPSLLGFGSEAEPANEAEAALSGWPNQVVLIIFLTGVVALFGWWKQVGFIRHTQKGSLKFLSFPLLLTLAFLLMGVVLSGGSFAGANNVSQILALLAFTAMVGYTEETMFRGILFFGSTNRFKELLGAVLSSVIFGLFHYLNMLGGAGFGYTTGQVVHAFADGFMYAALRLITGSLWPVMLLHAFWDFAVIGMQAGVQTAGGSAGAALANTQVSGVNISPIQILPGLLWGAFVFWRWKVRTDKAEVEEEVLT